MNLLSREEILKIHNTVLKETGGAEGVLNEHALLMLETQPVQFVFGQELYPGLFVKIALYVRTINENHIFIDGNKRTSISVINKLLDENGYIFEVKTDVLENFILHVVNNHPSLEEIALWIEEHSKPL